MNVRSRGTSILSVLMVLVLLALMMEVALRLLVAHLEESRQRSERHYASELARSGLAWAEACLATGKTTACDAVLKVAGGEIDVKVERDGESYRIRTKGRVLRQGFAVVSPELGAGFTPPPAAPAAPAPEPPETSAAAAVSQSPESPESVLNALEAAPEPTPGPTPVPPESPEGS